MALLQSLRPLPANHEALGLTWGGSVLACFACSAVPALKTVPFVARYFPLRCSSCVVIFMCAVALCASENSLRGDLHALKLPPSLKILNLDYNYFRGIDHGRFKLLFFIFFFIFPPRPSPTHAISNASALATTHHPPPRHYSPPPSLATTHHPPPRHHSLPPSPPCRH